MVSYDQNKHQPCNIYYTSDLYEVCERKEQMGQSISTSFAPTLDF